MSARLPSYAMLWRAAVSFARPRASAFVLWSTLVLALGSAALSLVFGHARGALVWSGSILAGGMLLVWSLYFVPNAVKLNTPATAKLLPQTRRRLMELSYLIWIGCILVLAAIPYPDSSSAVFSLALAAAVTLGVALSAAGSALGMVVIVIASFGSIYVRYLPDWLIAASATPAFLAGEVLALALLGAFAVRTMFPNGGDAHWSQIERRNRVRAEQTAGGATRMQRAHFGALWYRKTLRHDCAARDSRALALHALGSSQHIGEAVGTVVVLFLTGVGLWILATLQGPASAKVAQDNDWAYASVLLLISMFFAWRPLALMKATPGEQALVRLAPLMPATARGFNRHLGQALLRRALAGWAVFAGSALLLTWVTGASGKIMLLQAGICCLALPMVAVSLRDHARRAPLAGALRTLALIGSIIVCLVVGAIAGSIADVPMMAVAAACALLLAIGAVVLGLRAMEGAPCAFPALRMD